MTFVSFLFRSTASRVLCLALLFLAIQSNAGDFAAEFGQMLTGSIDSNNPTNRYTFTATAGDRIHVVLVRTSGTAGTVVLIKSPSGDVVAGNGGPSASAAFIQDLQLENSGTYTAEIVAGGFTGAYQYNFTLSKLAVGVNARESNDGPEALAFGRAVTGSISSGDLDLYTFSANKGDTIATVLTRTSGAGGTVLYLYDSAGTLIASAGNPSANVVFFPNVVMPSTGNYFAILVSGGLVGSYDYNLLISKFAPGVNESESGDGSEALTFGHAVSGSITSGDLDLYSFQAKEGDVIITALVRTSGNGGVVLNVYDSKGTLIAASGNNTANAAYLPNLVLPATDTYFAEVVSGGLVGAYEYKFSVSKLAVGVNESEPSDSPEGLVFGKAIAGAISSGDVDVYSFSATEGETISAVLTRTAGTGGAFVFLYDSQGTLISSSGGTSAEAAFLPSVTLPSTDTYYAVVVSVGLVGAYNYKLVISAFAVGVNERESGDDPEPLAFGHAAIGSITSGDMDLYSFSGKEGEVVTTALTRTSGTGGTAMFVFSSSGQLITSGGNVSAETVFFPSLILPATDTYFVLIVSGGLTGAYNYQLLFSKYQIGANQREPNDGPEALVFGRAVTGAITRGDTDFYTFSGQEGDVISTILTRTAGTGGTALFIYDSKGNQVTAGGSVGANVVFLPNLILPSTDTYFAMVVSGGIVGAYDYSLTVSKYAVGVNERENNDSPEALTFGRPALGSITNGDLDLYSFTANEGDVVAPLLTRTSGTGGAVFFLYDSKGNLITSGGSAAVDVVFFPNVILPSTDTYFVAIVSGGLVGSYDYKFVLSKFQVGVNERESNDGPEALTFGRAVTGSISSGDLDIYTFSADEGDVVASVLTRTSGTGGTVLYVYDSKGNPITSSGGLSANAVFLPNTILPKKETYFAVIISGGLLGAYDYKLVISKFAIGVNETESQDGPETLTFGNTVHGSLSSGDLDLYAFSAQEGDIVGAVLTRTSGTGGAVLLLYDDKGNLITSGGNLTANAVLFPNVDLPSTRRYFAMVVSGGLVGAYDYTLCTIKSDGPNVPEAGEGEELVVGNGTRTGTLTLGDMDAYTFSAIPGDRIYVSFKKTGGSGTPLLKIFAPDGTEAASANGTSKSNFQLLCSEQSGTYTLFCEDASTRLGFSYELEWVSLPGPPHSLDPEHPELAVFLCDTNAVLRWPTNASGFQLEYHTNPEGQGGAWTPIAPPYRVLANYFFVTNFSADPMRIYRLKK